jgi:putative two-component system hydrogenase maturation factor HypX/HoxX
VLQAEAEMDAGPVWAAQTFAMRGARKSSLYRNEVTEAAVAAVLAAVERVASGAYTPRRVPGQAHALMKQADRAIDWTTQTSAQVLARLHATDGFPGGEPCSASPCHLFDALAGGRSRSAPGELLGRRETALLRHDRRRGCRHARRGRKLPALAAFRRRPCPVAAGVWWRAQATGGRWARWDC